MKHRNFMKHENMKVNSTFLSCDGVQIGCIGNNIQGQKRSDLIPTKEVSPVDF